MSRRTTVRVTIDGRDIEATDGALLLGVLRDVGVRVPTLCHDERLTPYGGCRLCVVARRDGAGGLVSSCSTPVARGMVVDTDAPEVLESRKLQLQLLALNHRMECPVCERRGDCRFQSLLWEYGLQGDRLPLERARHPRDEKSPIITRDPEKCIVCGKCVRLCDEVQGVAAIGLVRRGLETRVSTFEDRPLDCEFCGQCANACPVGALVARPYVSDVPAWLRCSVTTTCSFCSCGCQIILRSHGSALEQVTSDPSTLPNHGKLCVKGWLGWDVSTNPERLQKPLVRRAGRLVEVEWDEALDAASSGLARARDGEKPVVGIGSARLTTEDAYLFQRLVRQALGSPHVDVGPVGGVGALVAGMGEVRGFPRSTATIRDLADADLVLMLRGDPGRTHPLVKTELVQGIGQRGQQLVLAHGLSGGLERHASAYLALSPASEPDLLCAVAARLLARRPELADLCRDIPGFERWSAGVVSYTPE